MPAEAPPELPHVTRRHPLSGAVTVHYACPTCQAELKSPVCDAGISDACPDCGAKFRVPGAEARRAEEQRAAAEAAKQREAEDRERRRRHADQQAATRAAADAARRTAEQPRRSPPLTSWCARVGVLLVIAGAVGFIVGVAMDTSVPSAGLGMGRVHNIGLLNRQLICAGVGAGSLLTGILLVAVSALGAEVHRWGARHTSD